MNPPDTPPYTALVSHVLFPLHERLKNHTSVVLRKKLEQSQWWNPKQLHELQRQRLKSFLTRIADRVPYYRKLFQDLDFHPQDLQHLEDLQHLPYLGKSLIRAHFEDLKAVDAVTLTRFNTSGSSGEPLIFLLSKERVSHDVAAKWRATRWWGVDIGDPEIVVWGSPLEINAQDRIRALRDRLLRTQLLPAFAMSEDKLDSFLTVIHKRRPRMLFGYPSSLSMIAAHARKRNLPMDDIGIKVAFVTAERLYDHQRNSIEDCFGCPVANGYGGRDAGFVAHQCPHGEMHITAEDIIVEIIDDAGHVLPPNQIGEIVVTHLASGDFPFLRYRTGDMGILHDNKTLCSCGRGLPILKKIEGRTTDFITAADGTVMHGLALIYILRDMPTIESFKIIQESLTHTRIQIVPDKGFNTDTEAAIRNGFRQRLGNDVRIDVELIDRIPPEASGKFRYVVSKLKQQ